MKLLAPELIPDHFEVMDEIEADRKNIYRKLVFSPALQAPDLLHRYFEAIQHLRHVLSFKNAQQEAQSEEEAWRYLTHLQQAMSMMVDEIQASVCISTPLDLFRLFRAVAPDAAARHPNQYRSTIVQVGPYIPPEPAYIAPLVDELFHLLPQIRNPLLRAIWLHHELIRIHPFVDGNGRTGRMAKNWLLMYELYPPMFIYGFEARQRYIRYIEESFLELEARPHVFHDSTRIFFEDELRRMKASTGFLLARLQRDSMQPFGTEDEDIRPYGNLRS
jgi:hypothetical protein